VIQGGPVGPAGHGSAWLTTGRRSLSVSGHPQLPVGGWAPEAPGEVGQRYRGGLADSGQRSLCAGLAASDRLLSRSGRS
jgi:hypothetical protein